MGMEKIDFKKDYKVLYAPSAKQPVLVDVPEFQFLMVDGEGDPNTASAYPEAINVLYSLSFTMKFMLKKAGVVDYGVPPLEGLWWAENMMAFTEGDRDRWKWTMLIMQPKQVTHHLFDEAKEEVRRKKELAGLNSVRLERFHEGLSAQVMHIGPYAAEGPTIAGLHEFIHEKDYILRGKHHEIYLGDPRRTAPERLKTVIRQPVGKSKRSCKSGPATAQE